jgi:hypothetical protein
MFDDYTVLYGVKSTFCSLFCRLANIGSDPQPTIKIQIVKSTKFRKVDTAMQKKIIF